MSLWNTVKHEVSGGMGILRKGLTEVLDITQDLTHKGRIKLEIQTCRSEIRNQLTELGGRMYELAVEKQKDDILGDSKVKSIFAEIKKLQRRIESLETELATLKESKE